MTTIIHKCTRCGHKAVGGDEYEAEVAFNNHTCIREGRRLEDMPTDLLRDVAFGRMTEDEAWVVADTRAKGDSDADL